MEPKDLFKTKHYMGFTHRQCEAFPCHDLSEFRTPGEFNCLYCTCSLYWLECPGNYEVITDADGHLRKDCSRCKLPHDGYERSWKLMNLSRYQKHPVIWKAPEEK
jgi:Zn-finger protein